MLLSLFRISKISYLALLYFTMSACASMRNLKDGKRVPGMGRIVQLQPEMGQLGRVRRNRLRVGVSLFHTLPSGLVMQPLQVSIDTTFP